MSVQPPSPLFLSFFFFNDTATTEIYTLSLHDALPILRGRLGRRLHAAEPGRAAHLRRGEHAEAKDDDEQDRKSTRLNSSHQIISYAVFCLKKKNAPDADARKTNEHAAETCPHTESSRP